MFPLVQLDFKISARCSGVICVGTKKFELRSGVREQRKRCCAIIIGLGSFFLLDVLADEILPPPGCCSIRNLFLPLFLPMTANQVLWLLWSDIEW